MVKVHLMDLIRTKGASERWACSVCGHQFVVSRVTGTKTYEYPGEYWVEHITDRSNPHPSFPETVRRR